MVLAITLHLAKDLQVFLGGLTMGRSCENSKEPVISMRELEFVQAAATLEFMILESCLYTCCQTQ